MKLLSAAASFAILLHSLPINAAFIPENTQPVSPYNLVVIVANCLSKSHLSLYGYSKNLTPNIDFFARDAYVFENLVSPSTWTPPVINELFSAKPFGGDFHLGAKWDLHMPEMIDYPIGRALVDQGYVYLRERLPDDASRPFISYFHPLQLHFPYDNLRLRKDVLNKTHRRIYKRILDRIDDIRLVNEPPDSDAFPALKSYLAFGVRQTLLPISDDNMWNGILTSLKEKGDTPAAIVASQLPPRLARRLAQIKSADQMTKRDKSAIVQALNRFVRRRDSPVGKILFNPRTTYSDDGMVLYGVKIENWNNMFTHEIENVLKGPAPFLTLKEGRIIIADRLTKNNRLILRQIYRETLEYIIPALTFHHPQHNWMRPRSGIHKEWRDSPDYEKELALFIDLYDANLADLDKQFGVYLEQLSKLGVLDKTIIVFMGDHGESFMEHDFVDHSVTKCYDEVINPPLLIRVPGRLAKTTFVDTQLRTADVLPTVLELMGLPPRRPGPAEPTGISLAPILNGGQMDIPAFSREVMSTRSIRKNNGWKFIWDMETGRRELYNWKTDPREMHNVIKEFPEIAVELEEELNRFIFGD